MKKLFYIFATSFIFISCSKDKTDQKPGIPDLVTDSLQVLSSDIPLGEYTDLVFLSENTGYAISSDGFIIKTTDGGIHWRKLNSPVSTYLHRIQFVNNQVGYILGGDNASGYLLRTTDAGETWLLSNFNTPEDMPTGFFFLNSNTGFIAGKKLFKKTADGGKTWSDVLGNTSETFGDVKFINANEGYVTAHDGKYYKTVNGGNSWQLLQANTTQHLREIFISPSNVYAKSGGGSLVALRSGESTVTVPDAISRFLFLTDNQCVGVGQHYETGFWPYGDIFMTNDNWQHNDSRKYTPDEAINFRAIARAGDHKTIMLGMGHLKTTIIQLNH